VFSFQKGKTYKKRSFFMKNKLYLVCISALILSLGLAACDESSGGGYDVTFSALTANGSPTRMTTQLSLTFSTAISGLSANDIALSGVSGVSKGTLAGSGPSYTLPISGFTADGTLNVAVSKAGYNITGSPKAVGIFYGSGGGDGDGTESNPYQLTENKWADGSLEEYSNQWFKFTATSEYSQSIHVEFGTQQYLTVRLYNSSGNILDHADFEKSPYGNRMSHLLYKAYDYKLTIGEEYDIMVSSINISGTYKIGFNNYFSIPPETTELTENTWADGSFDKNIDQWFKFTATATTQYIHFESGTLSQINVQFYDSDENMLDTVQYQHLYDSSGYKSFMYLTNGQEYYIRVTPGSSSYSGTYKIGFTKSTTAPSGS
jgi:hypothetical protein